MVNTITFVGIGLVAFGTVHSECRPGLSCTEMPNVKGISGGNDHVVARNTHVQRIEVDLKINQKLKLAFLKKEIANISAMGGYILG